MGNFIERLNFLIDTLADGKHTVFAKKAGIPTSTFQGYLNGRFPKQEHLMRIRKHFNVNLDWFCSGEGEPFQPQVFATPETKTGKLNGPDQKTPIYKEGEGKPKAIHAPDAADNTEKKWDNMGLGEAVEKLSKIFNAGDPTLIRAINANLDAFARTVDMADQIESLTARMERMEKIINALQSRDHCCVTISDNDAQAGTTTGSNQGEEK